MSRLILLRHGESEYNRENIFTGWSDVELSQKGVDEAKEAGELLKIHKLLPDICFTSWLKRAIHTTQIALKELEWEHIDIIKSWKLNERHYGAWQGQNKDKIKKEVGEEMFLKVRRGYDTPPPPLKDSIPDRKYRTIDISLLPKCESLKDTKKRSINYYFSKIAPALLSFESVLVSAHGNSLRSMVMYLEDISAKDIVKVEIPTGELIVYDFDDLLQIRDKKILKG